MEDTYTRLTQGFGQQLRSIGDTIPDFGNNEYVSGTKEFLQSNTLIAKLSFLFLIIILFFLLLNLGTKFIHWLLKPSSSPYLVNGLKDARKMMIVHQDPKIKGSKPVMRSVNEQDGLEFTYSVWIFIDNLEEGKGKYKHIFHKGDTNIETDIHNVNYGMALPNNAPGLYIDKNTNNLIIVMNTFTNIVEKAVVNGIPLNKWLNVIIRVQGKNMDVYINGTIVLRHQFTEVPKQNYGDIYVNMNGGFAGNLSDLRYFDYGLRTRDILNVVEKGPTLTMTKDMEIYPPYFSLRWYIDN